VLSGELLDGSSFIVVILKSRVVVVTGNFIKGPIMSSINYSIKEISCKVVYYGPELCGKTTNLQCIHSQTKPDRKGKLISLPTETDRTLFFDFLPLELGQIKGFNVRFHLYTVPGQVLYANSRKLILKNVDGVVFVADSDSNRIQANVESMQDLWQNLAAHGYNPEQLPLTIQYNKRDLPDITPIEELNRLINSRNITWYQSVATEGIGVFEALKDNVKKVLLKIEKTY